MAMSRGPPLRVGRPGSGDRDHGAVQEQVLEQGPAD
ncbi:MAG: hypothetical protein JWM18_3983, partial [Chloroflexi bacterium]|nr:hypothetical protein [Chloroflexota bacterium]